MEDLHCNRQPPHGVCEPCGELGQSCCGWVCRNGLNCNGTCIEGNPESVESRAHVDEVLDDWDDLQQLEPGDIQRGMAKIRDKVASCYRQFNVPGMVNVTLAINPSGRVSTAQVTGKFSGTPTGSCIERAVRSAIFPRFSGPAMTGIDYPFLLSH
jgi:hypothetical protein